MKVSIEEALSLLKNGEICSVPTETVYGLAAKYDDKQAITKIFDAKQRPLDHPLIVHIADTSWLNHLTQDRPTYVDRLVKHFWPGPLTIVLKKKPAVSDLITAKQPTVAIRLPAHPLFLKLLKAIGSPVVAPSANRFCQTSPTMPEHVEKGLGNAIPVLDGGACSVGIESTIILATEENKITLLRPGMISATELESIAGVPCSSATNENVKAPGRHKVHYQPKKPLFIVSTINRLADQLNHETKKHYYCMLLSPTEISAPHQVVAMPTTPQEYAQLLYRHWQEVSNLSVDGILIELPSDKPEWQGLRNRILKASSGSFGTELN